MRQADFFQARFLIYNMSAWFQSHGRTQRRGLMKSRWEIHRGTRIFYFDLSHFGLDDEGVIAECDEAGAVVMAEPSHSVLILNDVRGSVGSVDVIKYLQVSAERSSPFIAKAAVVGVTGSSRLLLQLVNRFSKIPIVPFDDIEDAKNWLVENRAAE